VKPVQNVQNHKIGSAFQREDNGKRIGEEEKERHFSELLEKNKNKNKGHNCAKKL